LKKIVYLICGHTGGHISSAKAIIAAMEGLKIGPFEHKIIDLTMQAKTFWTSIFYSYPIIAEFFPWLYKTTYYFSNDPNRLNKMYNIFYPFLYSKKLKQFLNDEKPNLIVPLVALAPKAIVKALKETNLSIPTITVVLDPVSVHAGWVHPDINYQLVATEEAKDACIKLGMPKDKISVIGFPIHPKFLQKNLNKDLLRKEMGLSPNKFTALVMGGGIGIGRISALVEALKISNLDIQLIVIAGYNKKLESTLLHAKFRFPIKVFGFTDKIPEIMDASDILITKAGPGAIFEAIAKKLPIIITNNAPGQEEGNVDYVKNNGIGVIARKPNEIVAAISKIQSSGTDIFKINMKRIENSSAVYEIAKSIANCLR